MHMITLSAIAGTMLAIAAFAPSGAQATTVLKCYDGSTGYLKVVPDSETISPNDGKIHRSDCKSSVNTVVENDMSIFNLTDGEKIKKAFDLCGIPNGPYRRKITLSSTDGSTDPRLDYVVSDQSGDTLTGSISTDIGIDPGVLLSAMVTHVATTNKTDTVSVDDLSSGPSQIADLGGFDFAYFEHSSGNNEATLICDVNMWYGDPPNYGIGPYTFNFPVNKVTVGWAMGPSGLGSQSNITAACGNLNPDVGVDETGSGSDTREKFTGLLTGFYKALSGEPEPPANFASCDPTHTAFYCDASEPAGTPNSCNQGTDLDSALKSVGVAVTGACQSFYFGATYPGATGC